ncbi:radical SAM protein [Clostridium baratii]|uniref:radical SAM protein n=1 Tax=Clostridium baratii TaxID=1561 RepID=UPI0030CBCAB2
MDKIKKFIDCYVPIYNCNFKCSYCYLSTFEEKIESNKRDKIEIDPEDLRKALSKKRFGGTLMLNFCATGETLLCKELLPLIKSLLDEGHYCMIVTNGSITPKFIEMSKFSEEQKKRLFIKFSFHYLELKRLNLMDLFFNNVNLMHKSGISYTIEVTPSDDYIPYIDEIKKICVEKAGALPHITVCRIENGNVPLMTKLDKHEFIDRWQEFNSELFNFKIKIFNEKRKEFCYAGAWSYTLDLKSGDLRQCYRGKKIQNIYEDFDEPIKEIPIGCNCVDAHCWNGHAFLAFGDIIELDAPTFEQERNRKTNNGEWITENMKNFMSSKLYETNRILSDEEKNMFNKLSKKYSNEYKIKKKIKRTFLKLKGK